MLREPNPTAAVHARLCEYNLSGQLPLQGGAPDIPSAGFHFVGAAAGGDVRALRDVRLAQGLSADVLLPGVSLAAGEAALEKLLPTLTARLAAAGDVAAMVEVANAAAADVSAAAAAAWVRSPSSRRAAATRRPRRHRALPAARAPRRAACRLGRHRRRRRAVRGGVGGGDGGGEDEARDEAIRPRRAARAGGRLSLATGRRGSGGRDGVMIYALRL